MNWRKPGCLLLLHIALLLDYRQNSAFNVVGVHWFINRNLSQLVQEILKFFLHPTEKGSMPDFSPAVSFTFGLQFCSRSADSQTLLCSYFRCPSGFSRKSRRADHRLISPPRRDTVVGYSTRFGPFVSLGYWFFGKDCPILSAEGHYNWGQVFRSGSPQSLFESLCYDSSNHSLCSQIPWTTNLYSSSPLSSPIAGQYFQPVTTGGKYQGMKGLKGFVNELGLEGD